MAFERISENLHRLNENIRSFAESSAEYYKLDLYKKTMKGATAAVKAVLVGFFMVFSLLFLSIALSFLLSDWIEDTSSGFFIVGGVYLILGVLILFFGGPFINKLMLSKTSRKFFQDSEDEEVNEPIAYTAPDDTAQDEIIVEDERV